MARVQGASAWRTTGADSFGQLPEPARRALMDIGIQRRWRDGQTLLWTGEVADSAFVVLKGRIRMRSFGPQGDEQIFAWIEPGMFGALASVLAGVAFPCDFVADGPCEVMHLERRRLSELLERDAPTALAVARMLGARLSLFMQMHMVQSFAPLSDRVWATLRRLARWQPAGGAGAGAARRAGRLEITQADLAHAVGASRYRVGLELKRLEAAGHVVLARGSILVFEAVRAKRRSRA